MQERESKKERKRKTEKKERRERERTRAHTKKRVRGTPDIICTFTESIQISSNPFPSSVFSMDTVTSDNASSFASFSSCIASISKAVCIGEVTVIAWFSGAGTTSLR